MMRSKGLLALTIVLVASGAPMAAGPAAGESQTQASTPKPQLSARVDVVLERYQADKKVSSMPFMLRITNGNASLRVGVDVPIGSTTQTRGTATGSTNRSDVTSVPEYRNVGTSIDAYVSPIGDDGKYDVRVTVNDTSIYDPDAARRMALAARGVGPAQAQRPVDASAFHTFTSANDLRMRDGETGEFVAATDKITGEIVRVNVTLTIVK